MFTTYNLHCKIWATYFIYLHYILLEGVGCTIESLPPYLSDENGVCLNGSVFESKQNCSFKCETGYIIHGNQNVTLECLENGNFSANIPTCESEYTIEAKLIYLYQIRPNMRVCVCVCVCVLPFFVF